MAKIEDQRPAAQFLHDIIHLTIKRCTSCQQCEWIDIPLHRDTELQRIARNRSFESPINPNGTHARHFHIRQCHRTRATWKTDNLCGWHFPAHSFDYFLRWSDTPPLELLRPQHASPSIEDLNNFSTSLKLTDQILD